jgi:prepilin-type N-terminal cleavage/methylation domain-containing protein/prepilin-type processing-associated H-X9-DG protein
MNTGPRLAGRSGFTLLEVLVVLSIVGILATMVCTQMSIAIDRSRASACLSNLRQIGLALQGYMKDNDDSLPPLTSPGRSSLAQTNVPTLDTVLLPYTASNTAVFHCPADATYFQTTGNSYDWNPLPMLQGNGTYNFKYPSMYFQMLDVGEASQIPLVTDKESFHSRGKIMNVLYADGHAVGT